MLAYRVAGDLVDECMHMSESTCLESMYRFCKAVVAVFGPEYLRAKRYYPAFVDQRGKRVFWYARQHSLHALRVEELSICLAGAI